VNGTEITNAYSLILFQPNFQSEGLEEDSLYHTKWPGKTLNWAFWITGSGAKVVCGHV
jgi:hypothetical protein